ncbi:MAG: hypothetical protein RIS70_579 [Planctomycetota bacterium]|jgi:metallo-beta-lactamase family protein
MKLHFLGANRQVTGSRYCLDAAGSQTMVDCGLFQERAYENRNWDPSPISPDQIDAMLLTHVHIDHSGLIPRLVREGFRGPIYATRASIQLAEVVLRDAAKIQSEDVEYKLRRHQREGRRGKYPPRVLYNDQDVTMALELFRVVPYDQPVQVHDSLTATFHDAGHVLGSAMVQCEVRENGKVARILFSGDIGQCNKPIIRDPSLPEETDYVVMESTYGDRDHNNAGDVETQLEVVVNETVERGGNVVIPTFAVERAQELMYYISRLVHAHRIPKLKVFLDSPMAVDVTEIYRGLGDFFDADTLAMMADNRPPLRFPGLTLCRSVKESKAINDYRKPCIIMASSGMCTAGRIKHHLRQNIGNPASTVLFVGYQGQGTLGRQIIEKPLFVRIHGADHKVRAQIRQIYGFSGHADRSGLLRWIGNLKHAPRQIFLTHGEENAAKHLADEIRTRWNWPVTIPNYGDAIELD